MVWWWFVVVVVVVVVTTAAVTNATATWHANGVRAALHVASMRGSFCSTLLGVVLPVSVTPRPAR